MCIQQEFSVDIDLRQMWTDDRWRFNTSDPDIPIYIPYYTVDEFWVPDVYFPNEKHPKTRKAPSRTMRLYSNGTVRYVTRYRIRSNIKQSCYMNGTLLFDC